VFEIDDRLPVEEFDSQSKLDLEEVWSKHIECDGYSDNIMTKWCKVRNNKTL
jgi:hypothetical protein